MSRLVAALCLAVSIVLLAPLAAHASGDARGPRPDRPPSNSFVGSAASACAGVTGPVPIGATTVIQAPYGEIRVHRCLAAPLTGLLNAAEAAGYVLGGGGYRSHAQQVAARKRNCVTVKPPKPKKPPRGKHHKRRHGRAHSQPHRIVCRVPTAPPGLSMHERGLAIDFTSAGGTLSAGAFAWLSRHAPRYGLLNLPSERWHWSTNGT